MCKGMPISTLKNSNNSFVSTTLSILSVIGIVAVIYFAYYVFNNVDILKNKSALTADVYNGNADVYLNDTLLGKTPFSSKEITPGENKIKIKNGEREYNTQIDFISNNKNYVHNVAIFADLGTSAVFSSVQEFWFEKERSGDVLRVVSDPADARVFIDNTEVGKSPYSSNQLSEGDYDLRIDYPGYEAQAVRISIKKGYTLNMRFKLFPIPNPANITLLEGATGFYNISTDNQAVSSDTQSWVKAVIYWNRTRGLNIEGTGLNKEQVFDYFIDYKGNVFGPDGVLIADQNGLAILKDAKKGAYLGRTSDGTGVTQEAKTTVLNMNKQGLTGKKATVIETGTGWLRVRSTAGLGGTEIARVTVGQTYDVLEEPTPPTGWIKIKVSDTIQGFVSADFVKVI